LAEPLVVLADAVRDLAFDALGLGAAFHLGDLEELEVVTDLLLEAFEAGDLLLGLGALAEELLRLLLIVPEPGRTGPVVQLIEFSLEGRDVKDAPLAS
jgi:hypothetical protein